MSASVGVLVSDVFCPRCTARIPRVAVDVAGATATCVTCDERFALPERLGRDRALRIEQPASITVERDEPSRARGGQGAYRDAAVVAEPPRRALRIEQRREWFPSVIGLPFSVVWNGMLVRAQWEILTQEPRAFPVLICSAPFAAAGLLAFVASVRGLFRRVRITLDGTTLVVRHWPRLWRAQCRIEVGFLRGLFVVRREGRRFPLQIPTTYTLCAEVAGGAVELATGFTSADEARYVAQVIEEHLGIGEEAAR